jgi:predicted RNase H-like HicB family nuclease
VFSYDNVPASLSEFLYSPFTLFNVLVNWMHDFDVVLLEDETGGYVAIVPALPGCHTQGDTLAEVMENVKEAIDLYLETLTADEKKDLLKEKVVGIQKVKALA